MEKSVAQIALSQARAAGSWRTIVAPPGEHRPLHSVGTGLITELLQAARDAVADAGRTGQTAYLQVLQNWGRQAGARTNHLCLDLYDLPQIPHEVAEEIGGAARFVIRESECPYCRAVRVERERGTRFIWEDAASIAFAPFASRSPFEVWLVPRHHEPTSVMRRCRRRLDRGGPPAGPRPPGPPGRAALQLVLHTAPVTGQWTPRTTALEIHPRLREIAGLELGTGLPVNSVTPRRRPTSWSAGWDAKSATRIVRASARIDREPMMGRRHTPAASVVIRPERGYPRAVAPPGRLRARRTCTRLAGAPDEPGPRRPAPGAGRPADPSRRARRAARAGGRAQVTALPATRSRRGRSSRPLRRHRARSTRTSCGCCAIPSLPRTSPRRLRPCLPGPRRPRRPAKARPWLYQIAHRVALDEIRRRRIIRFVPWSGESRGSSPSAERLVSSRASRRDGARPGSDPRTAALGTPARRGPRDDRPGAGGALGTSHVAARALLTRAARASAAPWPRSAPRRPSARRPPRGEPAGPPLPRGAAMSGLQRAMRHPDGSTTPTTVPAGWPRTASSARSTRGTPPGWRPTSRPVPACRATADPSPPMRAPAPAPGEAPVVPATSTPVSPRPSTGGPPAVRRAGPAHVGVGAGASGAGRQGAPAPHSPGSP